MLKNLLNIVDKSISIEDKLINDINQSIDLKSNIYLLSQKIFESNQISHLKRLKLHKELIKLSKQVKCHFSLAHNLLLIARVYMVLGDTKNAIEHNLNSLKKWKNIKYEPLAINGEISCYINLANTYAELGFYTKSLEYFQLSNDALKACKEDLIPYVRINLGLGNVYNKLNRYKKAESFFIKAHSRSKKTKNQLIIIPCEIGLIRTKMKYKDYHKVIKQCNNLLKRLNKIDTIEQKNPVLSTLGLAHLELKQYDLAEKYFTEHLELAKSVDNKGLSYDLLGKLYLKLKRYDQALSCFKKAFNIYKNLSSMQTNHNIIKNIALTYEKKGDKNKSLMFYKKYVKQLEKNNKEKFKLSKINQKKIIQGLESEFENKKNESHLKSSTQLLSITHNEILYEVIKNLESDSYNKNKLIQHIKNKIDTKIDWTDFLIAYENLNPEFFLAINKYKLSMTELKVCIYIKNGFDNYQIAGIMNITLRAVQQNRYRIKKKLDINQKLDSFILSI